MNLNSLTHLDTRLQTMKHFKKLICLALALALTMASIAFANPSASGDEAPSFDLTHLASMLQASADGSTGALLAGATAETRWNQQIKDEALDARTTSFFETYETPEAIAVAVATYLISIGVAEVNGSPVQFTVVAPSKQIREWPEMEAASLGAFPFGTIVTVLEQKNDSGWVRVTDGELVGWCTDLYLAPFDGSQAIVPPGQFAIGGNGPGQGGVPFDSRADDDLYWLALAIHMEAGSNWLSDEHQLKVGNVVLNRVAHPSFPPTTIHGVLHQPGQYCFIMRGVRQQPSERAFANAQRLLNGERILPANVVFQAEFVQGSGIHSQIFCPTLGTTTFFCYA